FRDSRSVSRCSLPPRTFARPRRSLQCAEALQSLLGRALQQMCIDGHGEPPERLGPVPLAPGIAGCHAREDPVVLLRGRYELLDRLDIFGVIELRGNTEKVREIEMPQPEHIDTRNRSNRVDVL